MDYRCFDSCPIEAVRAGGKGPGAPGPAGLAGLQASAGTAARLMKMLGSEHRLALLCKLGEGEVSAGELAEHAGLAQSAASQHLSKLKDVGLVATRRDAQTIYYRLTDQAALRVIGLLCDIFGNDAQAA